MSDRIVRSHRSGAVAARAPRVARRVSGPVTRRPHVLPGGAVAAPARQSTSAFERIRALPDHRVVDRLLRSRLWIWAVGLMLGGIVAMQVSLLKLNAGISRAVETSATLERQNGGLEADIARLSDTDRIQTGAVSLGMLMPRAGDVGYLTARRGDASRALARMAPPSDAARTLLDNHGVVPGSLADTAATGTSAPAAPEDATAAAAPAAEAATPTAPGEPAPSQAVTTGVAGPG